MKKWSVIFLAFLLGCTINSCKQKGKQHYFEIDGTVNIDSGRIYLHFYPDYIPNGIQTITAEIKNNFFLFSGYIPESQRVFITLNDDFYISSEFIIDKGVQTISIDVDSNREVPVVKNKTMLEEYPSYTAFYKEIKRKKELFYQKMDSLYKNYNSYDLPKSISLIINQEKKALDNESDSTLLKYTKKNPNSKIAFWELIRLMSWGYEPIFDSIYNTFSPNLKNGYAGQVLKDKLSRNVQLSIGHKFPSFSCQNINGENFSTDIFLKNKYTLVDFWYSGCGPCIRQFRLLESLYKQYGHNGFEVVAISTDQIKDKDKWENIIIKENLVWKQYWDKNGEESKKFSINAFPTNFLIDSTGTIIYKNIYLEELDVLLNSQLFNSK